MVSPSKKAREQVRLDEKNHVEEPLLRQLEGLKWEVIRLEQKQEPEQSYRENFTQVVMEPVLRQALKKINSWLEDDQIDQLIRQMTVFSGSGLIENNRHVLKLLLEGTSVIENRVTGDRSPSVRFVDFGRRDNNRFIAVSQFKLRILGTEHHILPDIVLFLNGLPIAVVECKSPKVKEPIPEAIDQLLRYSEQRGAEKEGVAPLFYYNQFVVATCRQEAKFGTISTYSERHFYRWADPYPRTIDELDHGAGPPNDQQRLVAGMMDKDNLLDIIRTFTVFSNDDKGALIKIVGRYQQFRAVKVAVKRLLEGKSRRDRSGIIWHTQGSGKSLTMMFMVREMYRHPQLSNWKIVFVTDRTQLEGQLSGTSQSVGYTLKVADSIAKLKELLPSDSSDLVMAMIHKFRETDLSETFPELNTSANILVMTDEAHRSQYKRLRANLDRAIPNATHIGYTGTPIDRTEQVFGDYIDKYTMRQSISDGVTLEIVYEGRTHTAEVTSKEEMDKAFADVFSDYNAKERMDILGYGSRQAYLEARDTIAAKARDMVRHYVGQVFANGFKAQIVATSREAAVRYKGAVETALGELIRELEKANPTKIDLIRLRDLKVGVVISGSHNDLPHIKTHTDPTTHEKTIKSFKLPFDVEDEGVQGNVGIIVVNNMLLTGFDAAIEQVMYLDKVITNHNLLQAIARVNRVAGDGKDKGFVIDYVGIGRDLKRALDLYDEKEQQEILEVLETREDNLRELQAASRVVTELLAKHGLEDLTDHDAFFDLFYDEDVRFEFILAFRQLTRALNLVFPAKEALPYLAEYQALAEINVLANKHFNDERLSMKGIPQKLRVITDAYLKSKGIEQKIKPISIIDEDFDKSVGAHPRAKTKAAIVEHAIRHHISVHIDEDPELYASFTEALEAILREFADNWERIFEELEKLRQKISEAEGEPTYGLHRKKQMPFFRVLKKEVFGEGPLNEDQIGITVALTQQIFAVIDRELRLKGFWQGAPARNRLKAEIQGILLDPQHTSISSLFSGRDRIIARVMELAQANNDTILYAH